MDRFLFHHKLLNVEVWQSESRQIRLCYVRILPSPEQFSAAVVCHYLIQQKSAEKVIVSTFMKGRRMSMTDKDLK